MIVIWMNKDPWTPGPDELRRQSTNMKYEKRKEPAEERGKGTPWSLHCRWPSPALLYLTHYPTPFRFPFFFSFLFVPSRGSWGSRVLGWLAGGMVGVCPPPPLVTMGGVVSMPGAPQGVFVFWVWGFFVFLFFSLHSTPTRWPLSHSWAMCLYTVIWLFLSVSFSVSFWFSFWSLSLL